MPTITTQHKAITFFACLGILALIAVSLFMARPIALTDQHWKNNTFTDGPSLSTEAVFDLLRDVHDPEINLNVVELGLVYKAESTANKVHLLMTLTTSSCAWSKQLFTDIRDKLFTSSAVAELTIALTFDPPWTLDRIDPVAMQRLQSQAHTHDTPSATPKTPAPDVPSAPVSQTTQQPPTGARP